MIRLIVMIYGHVYCIECILRVYQVGEKLLKAVQSCYVDSFGEWMRVSGF